MFVISTEQLEVELSSTKINLAAIEAHFINELVINGGWNRTRPALDAEVSQALRTITNRF